MNAEPTAIKRAASTDAREVARLLDAFNTEYGEPTPGVEVLEPRVRQLLATGEIVVLLVGEPACGLAELRFRRSVWSDTLDAYLEELYVAPDRRGAGLGRALLEAALALARDAGAGNIQLSTSEDDRAALALYESLGFTNREGSPDGPIMYFYERDL